MDGRFYIQYKNHCYIKRNRKTVYLRENDFLFPSLIR